MNDEIEWRDPIDPRYEIPLDNEIDWIKVEISPLLFFLLHQTKTSSISY